MRLSFKTFLLDTVLIYILAAALIWPLFKAKYLDKWASIESTFIADGRFLKQHWPHPLWQPLWYGGTRFDYIYPPGLRYGTAVLSKIFPIVPARAYHLYTALFYCAGICGVYLFVRVASGARGWAWLAAAAVALISPSFLFLTDIRWDAGPLRVPQRLGVLVRYGEGPHITALALLPIALAFSFRAMQAFRPAALALAGLFCALVVLNNFYGATALTVLFPILCWSLWVTYKDRSMWLRAAAIAVLAYGLTAFWLVPSYFRITLVNLKYVQSKGNAWSVWVALVIAAAYAGITYKLARRRPERTYPVLVWGALLAFTAMVLGYYAVDFHVIGDAQRLVPELDLAMILAGVEVARQISLRMSPRFRRALPAVLVIALVAVRSPFILDAWHLYKRDFHFERRIEYRVTDWMAQNLPDSRALAAGSVRFWYNAWYDLAQLGGGSEQGLLNGVGHAAQLQILGENKPERDLQWLLCLGVDAVITHDKNSSEIYHDLAPHKFAGTLPVIWESGEGDVIYRVPRRSGGLARVVDRAAVAALKPIPLGGENLAELRAYADLIEKGPEPVAVARWERTDELRIHADVADGQSVLVQVSHDPSWHAYAGNKPLPIRPDPLGQMLIDAPAGNHELRLIFELPFENRVGRGVTLLSAAAFAGLIGWGLLRRA